MTKMYHFAVRRPRLTLWIGLLAILAAASGLPRSTLRTDGAFLVPRQAPEVERAREIRQAFDLEDAVALVVETRPEAGGSESIFDADVLRTVQELTEAVSGLEGIDPSEVVSLTTERIRPAIDDARLVFTSVLEPPPATADDLEQIRREVLAMELYRGTLVSSDEEPIRATAIFVGIDAAFDSGADRGELHDRLLALASPFERPGLRIHVVGAPIAESLLGRHILEDLATLVPVTVLLMAVLFLLRYRNPTAMLLPLLEVGSCLVFVFGLLGHAGVPVSLPLTVLPVILTAAGVLDEVHVFDRYLALLGARPSADERRATLLRALDETAPPVVSTSLTTAVGLLSFLASPIPPIRHFGVFAAVGVLFCMVFTLTVVPAILSLDRSLRGRDEPRREAARLGRWGRRIYGRRRAVRVAAGIAVLPLLLGIAQVRIEDSWVDGFAPASEFRQSTETVGRLFHGTHLLFLELDTRAAGVEGELRKIPDTPRSEHRYELVVDAGPRVDPAALVGEQVPISARPARKIQRNRGNEDPKPNFVGIVTHAARADDGRIRLEIVLETDARRSAFLASRSDWVVRATGERLLDPRLIDRLDAFVRRLEEDVGEEGGVLAPRDQLAMVRYIVKGRKPEDRRPGGDALENHYLLSILEQVRGPERVREMIDEGYRRTVVTVFLENPTYATVGPMIEAVERRAREELEPLGVELGLSGDVAVSQTMIGAIAGTQIRSLGISLVGIFLAAAWLLRSPAAGAACVLPSAVGVAGVFAAMGVFGVPLGVATSLFAAMALGLGVDFAVHLVHRLRLHRDLEAEERTARAFEVAGPPILTNSLVLALGFGVLLASQVPANGRLGLMMVAAVLSSLAATFWLLPAVYGPPAAPQTRLLRPGSDPPSRCGSPS